MWVIPIYCWPAAWLSLWLAGAATATAYRLPMTLVPRAPLRLRTPLLSLHVSTLTLSPHAGKRPPYALRAPRLRLVQPGCEDN